MRLKRSLRRYRKKKHLRPQTNLISQILSQHMIQTDGHLSPRNVAPDSGTFASIEALAPRHHCFSSKTRSKGSAVGMTRGNHIHPTPWCLNQHPVAIIKDSPWMVWLSDMASSVQNDLKPPTRRKTQLDHCWLAAKSQMCSSMIVPYTIQSLPLLS